MSSTGSGGSESASSQAPVAELSAIPISAQQSSAAAKQPEQSSAGKPPSVAGHPLRIRHFRNLWMGGIVSAFGDQFYMVALPWLVLQITGSGLALGTILMAAAIPRAVLMLIGGAFTDRVSPRRVMIATASARTVFVAVVGMLVWTQTIHLWALYLLAVGFGTADAFAMPSASTLMPSLVPAEQLPQANATMQGSYQVTGIAGPIPAGFVVKAWGMAWAFFLDAFSFLFVIAALVGIPDPPRPAAATKRPSMTQSIAAGFKYVAGDSAIRSLLILATALNLCLAGPIGVGLAVIAKTRFNSAAAFGTLMSSIGIGALIGTSLVALLKQRHKRGCLLLVLSIVLGILTASLGMMHGLWALCAVLGAMGIASSYVNLNIVSWFQARVERAMLGRVMSVAMLAAFGLMPVSQAIAGVLVQWSLKWMYVGAGSLMVLVTMAAVLNSSVRQID